MTFPRTLLSEETRQSVKSRKVLVLRELVGARTFDRPSPDGSDLAVDAVLCSGIAALDDLLPGGGIMAGRLSEISGRRSSGKRSLALAFGAGALTAGRRVAWIDGSGRFYPLPSLELGAALERLLVLRLSGHPPRTALKAASMLLEAGQALSLIVIDAELRHGRLSSSQLARLQLEAERSGTALLFVSETTHPPASSLGTFIALHLTVERLSARQLRVAIAKSKRGKTAQQTRVEIDVPHGVRLDTTV